MPATTASTRNGIITLKTWSCVVHHAWMPEGSRETIEAKISSEMPLPMPRWVISSPIHISRMQPVGQADDDQEDVRRVEVRDDRFAGFGLQRVEQEHVADRLGEGEPDGQVARVLGDAGLADLAFLGELLQRGHRHLQQLQDDRGGDVGHDAQREDRDPRQAAAGEQVQKAEDVGAAELLLDVVDRREVDARHGDVRARAGRSASIAAVKAIFLRMSATWKALRIVESMGFVAAASCCGARG